MKLIRFNAFLTLLILWSSIAFPQKDPDFYDSFLFSYNVPEFVISRITLNPYAIERTAKKTTAVQVQDSGSH